MKKDFAKTYHNGFTLIETVVYIALFGVLMSGVYAAIFSLLSGMEHTSKNLSMQQEVAFIQQKLDWELTDADQVHIQGMREIRIEPGNRRVGQTGTALTISRNAGNAVPLSSARHKVGNVEFSVDAASGTRPAFVRMQYTIDEKLFSFGTYLRQ